MKLFLIDLLKEQDVPGFRTHNAWSKATWTTIVRHVNTKFGTSYSLNEVKQQEQDLKKAYRSVKDLLAESGFGWDNERMMVIAPASVWASFTARKNNKDALHWQDRSSHIMMLYLHSTMVITLKGEPVMAWTIMQPKQRMLTHINHRLQR